MLGWVVKLPSRVARLSSKVAGLSSKLGRELLNEKQGYRAGWAARQEARLPSRVVGLPSRVVRLPNGKVC